MKRFIILFLLISVSCTHRPYVYEAEVKDENGKTYAVRSIHKESYYGHSTMCALSAYFLGGLCWLYLVNPEADYFFKAEEKAKNALANSTDGRGYFILTEKRSALSWNNSSEGVEIVDRGQEFQSENLKNNIGDSRSQKLSASLVLGTDHSPFGVGPKLSWNSGQSELFIAYGLFAKQNILGKPWAIGAAIHRNNLFARSTVSYFQGNGERYPVYEEGHVGEKSQMDWKMTFLGLSVGVNLDLFNSDRVFPQIEAGYSLLANSKISAKDSNVDISTVGRIEGIARKDAVKKDEKSQDLSAPEKFSKGKGGPYVQIGFNFKI